MNKEEFLKALRRSLTGVPQDDVDRSIEFYAEMIDDRIEEGIAEEDAVSSIGDISVIASQIRSELPFPTLVRMNIPKRQLRPWEIVLLILGSPVWFPILLSVWIIALSLYIVLWSVVLTITAAAFALICSAVCGVVVSLFTYQSVDFLHAALLFGMSCMLSGISILLMLLSVQCIKGVCRLTKTAFNNLKRRLSRKECAQ